MKNYKNNFGKYAAIVTAAWAALCPICYLAPLLIGFGAGSTLIFTALFGEKILIALILISLVGFYFSYKTHKNLLPIALGVVAGGLMYYGRFVAFNFNLLYVGSALMIGAAVADIFLKEGAKIIVKVVRMIYGKHK